MLEAFKVLSQDPFWQSNKAAFFKGRGFWHFEVHAFCEILLFTSTAVRFQRMRALNPGQPQGAR
jgi:hypothetical protein